MEVAASQMWHVHALYVHLCSCVVCTSLFVSLSEYENVKEDLAFCYGVQIGSDFHTNTSSQSIPKRQSVLMCGVRDIDSI